MNDGYNNIDVEFMQFNQVLALYRSVQRPVLLGYEDYELTKRIT